MFGQLRHPQLYSQPPANLTKIFQIRRKPPRDLAALQAAVVRPIEDVKLRQQLGRTAATGSCGTSRSSATSIRLKGTISASSTPGRHD
jgi:hypothetical protein